MGRGRGRGGGGPQADNTSNGPDLYEAFQWDIKRVTNDGASFGLSTGSHDVVVAVIDTGIYPEHPDLSDNLLPGSQNFVPAGGFLDLEPYETGDPDDFMDRHGHGTHVAGAVAANGRILGVGPDLGFRAYKVFGASSAFSEWIWAAIIAAADDGVDVINMSLGGLSVMGQVFLIDPDTGEKLAPLGNDSAIYVGWLRAVQYASQRDVIVVSSAGNTGLSATRKTEHTEMLNDFWAEVGLPFMAEGATFVTPAGLPEVVSVSATGPDETLAS